MLPRSWRHDVGRRATWLPFAWLADGADGLYHDAGLAAWFGERSVVP